MPETNETLYLIDGSGFIFRAFYALPELTRADGVHVNAVYGFCKMLSKLIYDLNAHKAAVVFDVGKRNFRHDIYPEYKANRPPVKSELTAQFPIVREAAQAYGVPGIGMDGYEADDMIATYARKAEAEGRNVVIVSSDKDLMQLVTENVVMFDPLKSVPITTEDVILKFGVTPDKVIDVQALAGDSVDNVPGVRGIGIKKASDYIKEYGDLENLLAHVDEIKQKGARQSLIENADMARLSKQLVALNCHAPMPIAINELVIRLDRGHTLIPFLEQQGFVSLIDNLVD